MTDVFTNFVFFGGAFRGRGLCAATVRPQAYTKQSCSNVMVVVLLVAVLLMVVIKQHFYIYHYSEAKGEGQL